MSTSAQADTILIPDDFPTIQAGIDAANDGDEVIVKDNVWTGPGNRDLDFGGKNIVVASLNGPDNCIIDCQGQGRAFIFSGDISPDAEVDGFHIKNGSASQGGGIFINGGSPSILDCTFTNCSATFGGAIYINNSASVIINCRFESNTASSNGAGAYCANGGNADFFDCTFSGNDATGPGGAIAASGSSPTVNGCDLNGNTASVGGGAYFLNGSPNVVNTTMTDNVAGSFGGGMTCDGSNANVSDCTFDGNSSGQGGGGCANSSESNPFYAFCIFSNNTSRDGGAIFNFGIPGEYRSCTITGNTATRSGGGAYCSQANIRFIACEVNDNTATLSGGGFYNSQSNSIITNCAVANNTAVNGGGCYNSLSNPIMRSSALWWNLPDQIRDVSGSNSAVSYCNVEDGWGGTGNIDQDPLFVDGPGGNLRLLPGSPNIDAGNNSAVPFDLDFDLDGNPRFHDDPCVPDTGNGTAPIVDIGPYEFPGSSCSNTQLTGFNIVRGTLLDGGLPELQNSDNTYLHTRSGFGRTLIDLHSMEVVVSAETSNGSPSTIDLKFESRIDETTGLAQIRLFNWNTSRFDFVGTHPLGNTDNVNTVNKINAANYVNTAGKGEIDLSISHLVFVPFFAFTFESFIDQVEIVVK